MSHQELLERVEELLARTAGAAFVVPADTGHFSIADELVERVQGAMQEAVDLLRDLSEHYSQVSEDEGEEGETDPLKGIGAQIASELAAREITSLAFAGRYQVAESREALAHALAARQVWLVASHADTGLRRIAKALITVEAAVREFEGLPVVERKWIDLEVSFEIRRLYGQFRRAVLRGRSEATGEEQVKEFKGVARRISILRDLKIYPFMRIDDRLAIRKLQKRILAWLDETPDQEAGCRLWQDLESFARLLEKVNEREELRQHDRQVLVRFNNWLHGVHLPGTLSAAQREELDTLMGLDDELDELLMQPDLAPATLRTPIARLYHELHPLRASHSFRGFRE